MCDECLRCVRDASVEFVEVSEYVGVDSDIGYCEFSGYEVDEGSLSYVDARHGLCFGNDGFFVCTSHNEFCRDEFVYCIELPVFAEWFVVVASD